MSDLTQVYATRVEAGTLNADPAQEKALAELERIRSAVANPPKRGWFSKAPEPPKGLYLWGGVGRGKSMLMDMFVNNLPDDVPARRVHFHAFMQEIQNALHRARQSNTEDAIKPVAADVAKSVRVLAFDEMQITDVADAMIVGRLFEALFKDGVTVVTTSNRVPDDLYKDGLNRQIFLPFIDILKEHLKVHELVSETDYRQNRLAGEQTYFTPANRENRAKMDAIWQDLTGGDAEPLELTVNKRKLIVPAFRNGAARAPFFELCGKPLGASDFLAIADAVRVLMIDDIPCLSRHNFNEAKRFVTLIDALYEAKIRLIASAADKPESLFLEGTGAFEFERTASRLREMQSEGWGQS